MAAWIERSYRYVFEESVDPRTHTLPLISSPVPIFLIVIFYYRLVYHIGPAFMKGRKPFKLDRLILIYNLIQIITCSYIVIMATPYMLNLDWRCSEISYSSNDMGPVYMGYVYFCLKLVDLCETVFFVLRNKMSQVTYLHVYHHIIMALSTWMVLRYFAGGHSCYLPYINSFVHAVMYTYYLVSNYTKSENNIWWKKYITQMQLVQFVALCFVYLQPIIRPSCGYHSSLSAIGVWQSAYMLILFGKFYYKAYLKKKTK